MKIELVSNVFDGRLLIIDIDRIHLFSDFVLF